MFAQLGTILFEGLQTFVTYGTSEEMTLAQFALLNRKPKLMAAGVGLIKLDLSIFLHVEFTPGSVEDVIQSLRTSKNNFEILPLLWGNGETFGEWAISTMEVEYTNLDAQGNVYEARINLSLLESVADNKQPANNAFAAGDKKPATKSKRVNKPSCQRSIANLVQEIQQFGNVINSIIAVYTGDQTQATKVEQACQAIDDDCTLIGNAVRDPSSCVSRNTSLFSAANTVGADAVNLATDIHYNAAAVSGFDVSGHTVKDGTAITAENTGLQAAIKSLLTTAQPIIKTAIIQ
jgi:phage protein U